jgi:tetratricopeptide (TPR) repeat protein
MKRLNMSTFASVLALLSVMVLGCAEVQKPSLDAEPYYIRGFKWAKIDRYDLAINDFTKAIDINPRYAEAYSKRGAAYINKGEYDKAISDSNKAIEINPNYAEAYGHRGWAYGEKASMTRLSLIPIRPLR